MPKPKLLILIDWYLPGYRAGGPIQSIRNLVQALGDEYNCAIITTDTDHAMDSPYPEVSSDQWTEGPDGSRVYYFSQAGLSYQKLSVLIEEEGFDFLYLNSMYSVPFTIWPLWKYVSGKIPGKIVLAPRGMLQAGAVRIKAAKKRLFLSLMRLSGIARRIRWHATDEQEAEDVQRFFGKGLDIQIAPNFPKQEQLPWESVPKQPGEATFVFASRVSRKKNLEFFLHRLPLVQGRVSLDIYGPREDPAYYQSCLSLAESLPADKEVRFHGAIPAPELPLKLLPAHFSVLTTTAENFGHSIFEGMLAGKPVLISNRTPWLQLADAKAGWDIPLEQPQAFVEIIQSCIDMDQATYDEWSQSAWDYARTYKEKPDLRKKARIVFSTQPSTE